MMAITWKKVSKSTVELMKALNRLCDLQQETVEEEIPTTTTKA